MDANLVTIFSGRHRFGENQSFLHIQPLVVALTWGLAWVQVTIIYNIDKIARLEMTKTV